MLILIFLILFFADILPQDGLMKSFYSNGNLESEMNFRDSVREGEAKFFFENGNLKEERTYSNGKVDGLVKIYSESGKLKETFVIENGRREGPTSFFDENGNYLADKFYENGKIVVEPKSEDYFAAVNEETAVNNFVEPPKVEDQKPKVKKKKKITEDFLLPPEIEEETMEDDPAFFATIEVMPEPVGGMEAIFRKLIYPSEARKNEVEGVVKVQAFIDEFGEVIDAQVIEGIGSGCDDVARNAIYFAKFKPGMQRGKTVRAMMVIPIKFNPQMNQN